METKEKNKNFHKVPKPYFAKPNNKKYTLILDLEETLGDGDLGLGPIPNSQSPLINRLIILINII